MRGERLWCGDGPKLVLSLLYGGLGAAPVAYGVALPGRQPFRAAKSRAVDRYGGTLRLAIAQTQRNFVVKHSAPTTPPA